MENRKIKIFYLITKSNWGGAQRYVYDLATNLPTDQYEIKVIFGQGGELEQKLTTADIETLKIGNLGRDIKWLDEFRVLRRLVRLFKQEKPDIIHLNSSKIGGLGAVAGRLAGVKKIIFTAHGWAFNEERPAWQKLSIKFLHWLTALFCHQIIAVSTKTKDQMANWPLIGKKIGVIYNGISAIAFLDQAESRRELLEKINIKTSPIILKLLEEKTIIGTISELHKNKGLDFLLEAVWQIKRDFPNVLIWIMGEGDDRARLERLITDKGLTNDVVLFGRVNEAKIYLKALDIFSLTSRKEGFPYAILEAGQAGLPILASYIGGISEVITQAESGILVRPGNIRELKYALTRLLTDEKLRAKLGHNIQKTVAKKFTLEQMVKETIALYKN